MGLDTQSTPPSIVSEKESLSAPIKNLLSELGGQKACGVDEINLLPARFPQSHTDVPASQTLKAKPVSVIPGASSDFKVPDLAGEDEIRIPEATGHFPGGDDVCHKIGLVSPKTREVRGSLYLQERPYNYPISPLLLPTVTGGGTDGMGNSSDSGLGVSAKILSDHEPNGYLPEGSQLILHPTELVPEGVLSSLGLEEVKNPPESEERWNEYTASVILRTPKKEWMIEGIEIWGNSLYDASVKKTSDQELDRCGHEMPIHSPPRDKGADKDIVDVELRGEYGPNIPETNEIPISTSTRVEESTVGLDCEGISGIHSSSTGLPQTTGTEQITDAVESCGGGRTTIPAGITSSDSMTNEYQDSGLSREGGAVSPHISLNNSEELSIESLLKTLLEKELRKYARAEVSSAGTLLTESANQVESSTLKEEPNSHNRCENIVGGTVLCRGDHDELFLPLEESENRLESSGSEEQAQPVENIVGGTLWYRGHDHEPPSLLENQVSPVQSYPHHKGPKRFANILDTFSYRSELLLRGLGNYDNVQLYQKNVDSPPSGSQGEGPIETPQVDGADNDSREKYPPASTDGNSATEPTDEEGSEFPGILMPSSGAPGENSSIPSDSSSCDSAEEDVPPPMPLYSDEVLNEYLKEMDEIYENIKVNDRLLKSLVRQVFDGELTMSRFRENAYVSKGAKRVYASLEENSADVKALLALLETKLAVFTEKQQCLVKLIVGEINPHTGGFWTNHTRLDVPGVPIDNPRLPKQPYYG